MNLIAIAALAKNRVIGKDGQIPWHIPEDLKRFRAVTMGFPVIMGRGTFESLRKPLEGRTNIVLSTSLPRKTKGVRVVRDVLEALQVAKKFDKTGFLIGGQEVFERMLCMCDRMWLTEVQENFEGDVFFPEFDRDLWTETFRFKYETNEGLRYDFVEYVTRSFQHDI